MFISNSTLELNVLCKVIFSMTDVLYPGYIGLKFNTFKLNFWSYYVTHESFLKTDTGLMLYKKPAMYFERTAESDTVSIYLFSKNMNYFKSHIFK